MAYQEPDVYITIDASAMTPIELPAGGNAVFLGTANKGAFNVPIPIGKSHFSVPYEEISYGTIGATSGTDPLSLVRAVQLATRDSGAYIWGVRVGTNNAAAASGTLENLSDGWGVDLTSYYKGTWYHGDATVSANTDGTFKLTLAGSSTTNMAGWSEIWDKIPSDATCAELVQIINGTYTDEDGITYKGEGGIGQFEYASKVGNTITPSVDGSMYFTCAVASGTAVTISATSACNLENGDDGNGSISATDIETIHATYFAQESKFDVLHFAGMKIDDCNTQIKAAVDNAELERCWRIAVQGTDEPATKTAAAAVTEYISDTTTHEKGYLIKWASCWTNYDDPYEIGKYPDNPQKIDLGSQFTAAWFVGELVSPNGTGLVDESEPKSGALINEEGKYAFNRAQRGTLLRAKVTFTNKIDDYNMKIVRSQTAYGTGSQAAAWRNPSVVRLVNQLKKAVVDLGRKFTIKTKNLPRNRTALKNALKKVLDLYVEMEKLTSYSGLKVYASREDENNGICRVDFTIQPVQPLLFVAINMILE